MQVAEILFFHHALGLTPGVLDLAETLRRAGHTVHTPDLYDGKTFNSVEAGVNHARSIGFGNVIERGERAAADLPAGLIYAGISLGVLPTQKLAQTRPGARGALLLEACVPPGEFGTGWPAGVPVQIHGMDADPSFAGEGDLDAARALVASTPDAELILYPGDKHLFTDNSFNAYDAAATAMLTERVLAFLSGL
jgi:dienelactone hydrolase